MKTCDGKLGVIIGVKVDVTGWAEYYLVDCGPRYEPVLCFDYRPYELSLKKSAPKVYDSQTAPPVDLELVAPGRRAVII